jgi:EmrB/QacA subfamily drug resistance transporter
LYARTLFDMQNSVRTATSPAAPELPAPPPQPPAPPAPPADRGHPRRWLILAIVLVVECMDLLDGTIVNVAAPTIRADLGASTTALQWIVGGYALALAVGLVVGARLGDLFGRRRLFAIGIVLFTLSSLLSGIAPSTGLLIAFRLSQGLAAALMIPQGFGIIHSAFSTEDLPKAFGIFGPVIGLSAVLGPILGGALVDADLFGTGWRLIFLINLPLGILALAGALRVLPESRTSGATRLDWRGAILVGLAAGLLVYPLIQGREADWAPWTFAMIAASLGVLALFAWTQRRREQTGRDPLITTSLFAKRAFSSGQGVVLLFFSAFGGLMLAITLYLQLGRGFSAIHAGLTLGPLCLGLAIGAGLSGAVLTPRFGRRVLHAGFTVLIAGVGTIYAVIDAHQLAVTSWQLAAPLLGTGLGVGLVVAPLFGFILAAVDDEEVGSASGVLNALQQLASAIGVALLGTVFFAALPAPGYADGLERVLLLVVGLTVAAMLLALLLPRHPREEELG